MNTKIWARIFFFALIGSLPTQADTNFHGQKSLSENDGYITGGIVGTIVGLGIGHAIERRYWNKGLLFSITEGTSIALIIVGAVVPMPRAAGISMTVVGALGLTAFKIWEIVDIWTGPMPREPLLSQHVPIKFNPMLQAGLTISLP